MKPGLRLTVCLILSCVLTDDICVALHVFNFVGWSEGFKADRVSVVGGWGWARLLTVFQKPELHPVKTMRGNT